MIITQKRCGSQCHNIKLLKQKKMKNIFLNFLAVAVIFIVSSCNKDTEYTATQSFPNANTAYLKINYASMYPANPSVQIAINDVRVSGAITGRTPFPGGGYNTSGSNFPDYLAVKAGVNKVSIVSLNKGTQNDSLVLFFTNFTLDAGKHYTAHIADTGSKTRAFLQEDILGFSDTTSRYRFVNLMPNVPLADLYYGTTLVSTGIPYLGSSAYFDLPSPATSLGWFIRETGSSPTSTALATYLSSNTSIRGRIYTAFALGYKGQTATTTKPYISFFLVQ